MSSQRRERWVKRSMTERIRLREICHARAGDKSDTANAGIICYQPAHYPWIVENVTAEAVAGYLGDTVGGPVERYELPKIAARVDASKDVIRSGEIDYAIFDCQSEFTIIDCYQRKMAGGVPYDSMLELRRRHHRQAHEAHLRRRSREPAVRLHRGERAVPVGHRHLEGEGNFDSLEQAQKLPYEISVLSCLGPGMPGWGRLYDYGGIAQPVVGMYSTYLPQDAAKYEVRTLEVS